MSRIEMVEIPNQSQLSHHSPEASFSDSFGFVVADELRSPQQVYLDIFGHLPAWIERLMRLRNQIVGVLGFESSPEITPLTLQKLMTNELGGIHQLAYSSEQEIVCTSRDKHIQVSLSVLKLNSGKFVLSTQVDTFTLCGAVYLQAIIPFHKLIAASSIRSMLRREEHKKAEHQGSA